MPAERRRAFLTCLLLLALLGAGLTLVLAACARSGIYHVVGPGQTLYRIARTYGLDQASLAKANGISDPARIEVGQRLFIPGATQPLPVPPPVPARAAPPSKPASPQPAERGKSAPGSSKAKAVPEQTSQLEKPEDTPGPPPVPGAFAWPVRGEVILEFGAGEGASPTGIEIAVPPGTPVAASAAGKVIYSGEMRGYGNLVILEHADNFFTVYGFNSKNLVTADNYVGQGDRIALSGVPPGGKSPRLHFEIRKGKTAANPIFFLP